MHVVKIDTKRWSCCRPLVFLSDWTPQLFVLKEMLQTVICQFSFLSCQSQESKKNVCRLQLNNLIGIPLECKLREDHDSRSLKHALMVKPKQHILFAFFQSPNRTPKLQENTSTKQAVYTKDDLKQHSEATSTILYALRSSSYITWTQADDRKAMPLYNTLTSA